MPGIMMWSKIILDIALWVKFKMASISARGKYTEHKQSYTISVTRRIHIILNRIQADENVVETN